MTTTLEHVANAAKNLALTYDMAVEGYRHAEAVEADLQVLEDAIKAYRASTAGDQAPLPHRWQANDWHDREYRHAYAEDFVFSRIATQIVVIREQRGWTPAQLAAHAGIAHRRVTVMEDVNYQRGTIRTLLRLAQAFDCWLHVSFESFRTLPDELARFSRTRLQRVAFDRIVGHLNQRAQSLHH